MEDIKRSLRTSHKSKNNPAFRSFLNKIPTRGSCWNLHISCKDSGNQTTRSGWKEDDFRVVKIEAELILEANRLQLMKQDLEKAENAYLSSFTSKKSKTLPNATAAAHGDLNGKNDYQKKGGKQSPRECFIQKDGAVRSKRPLELLHMDHCGPMPTESQGGNKYLSIIDDYSRKVTVFPIRNKSDVFHTFIRFQKRAERFLSKRKDNTESQGFSDLSEQQEALMVEVTIPNCYKQAIRSRDASKWHDAMDKEINVMMERKVWDLVDHPENIKILENRWVFTIKYDENNKIVRYKARLVARGNTQLRGESFDEKNFDLKIMGKTKKLLGIEFEEIGNSLFIHQRSYIRRLCEIYEKYKYPVSSLPISKGQVLSKLDSPKTSKEILTVPYRNLIASLSFIAIRTRPDIMYAVNVLSQFQANPGIKHGYAY
ncbi:retrovirus-related Pol polyprotein from transposon TNT 1-94 [Trichonephila clavipes]|nr:retrovirus-related Pol polyprotein from transposon TNT 1-94 [Trichonephila clavipes]